MQLAVGHSRACALRADGRVVCWGAGVSWANVTAQAPTLVQGLTDVAQIAGDLGHWCARRRDGAVHCWDETLRTGPPVATNVVEISEQSMRLADGTVRSHGAEAERAHDPQLRGLTAVRALGRGAAPCAIHTDGGVSCWGSDVRQYFSFHLLPGEAPDPAPEFTGPVRLPGVTAVDELWTSQFFPACARSGGRVLCWGGEGSLRYRPAFVPGLDHVSQVAVAEYHACALLPRGRVACWGANASGQLGRASPPEQSARPLVLAGLAPVVEVAVGGGEPCGACGSTCVRSADGEVRCFGQLGNDRGEARVDLSSAQEPR